MQQRAFELYGEYVYILHNVISFPDVSFGAILAMKVHCDNGKRKSRMNDIILHLETNVQMPRR